MAIAYIGQKGILVKSIRLVTVCKVRCLWWYWQNIRFLFRCMWRWCLQSACTPDVHWLNKQIFDTCFIFTLLGCWGSQCYRPGWSPCAGEQIRSWQEPLQAVPTQEGPSSRLPERRRGRGRGGGGGPGEEGGRRECPRGRRAAAAAAETNLPRQTTLPTVLCAQTLRQASPLHQRGPERRNDWGECCKLTLVTGVEESVLLLVL